MVRIMFLLGVGLGHGRKFNGGLVGSGHSRGVDRNEATVKKEI